MNALQWRLLFGLGALWTLPHSLIGLAAGVACGEHHFCCRSVLAGMQGDRNTATVAIHTRFAPRWIAILGYALAAILLFGSSYIAWCLIALPLWVFAISLCILRENYRRAEAG